MNCTRVSMDLNVVFSYLAHEKKKKNIQTTKFVFFNINYFLFVTCWLSKANKELIQFPFKSIHTLKPFAIFSCYNHTLIEQHKWVNDCAI